jgi:hypothetical protein
MVDAQASVEETGERRACGMKGIIIMQVFETCVVTDVHTCHCCERLYVYESDLVSSERLMWVDDSHL